MPKKNSGDVLLVTLSDMHSGSNYALFLNRQWEGAKGNTHYATSTQVIIRKQWEEFATLVASARNGRKVILVHNGDSLDGDHHHSGDVCTTNVMDQADIHVELIAEFQKLIKWQAGDELYYTRGTQTHVNEMENYIGRETNAVMCGDFYVHNLLKLPVNGVSVWYVHHGPGAGAGANEGNQVRSWLRNIHIDADKDGSPTPDIIYTGHVHNPTYSTYTYRKDGMNFRNMHGIICPSWQAKTRYALMRAPVSVNKIGGVMQEIKADGLIGVPQFSVSVTVD